MTSQELWWVKHRKKKYKPRNVLTLEQIVRLSIKETVKEFVANTSTLGVKQICERDIGHVQRAIWIAFLFAMTFTMGYFLLYIWNGTLSKPLIVNMESNTYPISEIDFPAVALCNINRISKKALKVFAEEVEHYFWAEISKNESLKHEVEWLLLQAGRLLDFSLVDKLRNHPFLDVIFKEKLNTGVVISQMEQISPQCEEMLHRCSWNGRLVNCSSIFKARRTVHGFCCAFNYVIGYNNSANNPSQTIDNVKRQIRPGPIQGLNVIVDPMIEDYAYPIYNMEGIELMLFDPYHFADPSGGRVINRFAEPNQMLLYELQSVKQVASDEVRKYAKKTRNCLFHDERPESFGKIYSYSTCMMRCRIMTIRSLCKCIPYYLPTDLDDPICTFDELRCLNKYQEKFIYVYPMDVTSDEGLQTEIQSSLFCPECLPDCELTQHYSKSLFIPILDSFTGEYKHKAFHYHFLQGINMTNKMYLSIYQATSDGVLNRLDVVAYWFEITSTLGGFWGILVGFAIISQIETIYFITVRFVQILIFNYLKHRE